MDGRAIELWVNRSRVEWVCVVMWLGNDLDRRESDVERAKQDDRKSMHNLEQKKKEQKKHWGNKKKGKGGWADEERKRQSGQGFYFFFFLCLSVRVSEQTQKSHRWLSITKLSSLCLLASLHKGRVSKGKGQGRAKDWTNRIEHKRGRWAHSFFVRFVCSLSTHQRNKQTTKSRPPHHSTYGLVWTHRCMSVFVAHMHAGVIVHP